MLGWVNRDWNGDTKDPRPEKPEDEDYEKWMQGLGYEVVQEFGNPDGYSYELWSLKGKAEWMVVITDGKECEDVSVRGFRNLADIMSHLGPGATASVMDGEELGMIWAERSEFREQRAAALKHMQGFAEHVGAQLGNAMAQGCQCEKCIAERAAAHEKLN